MTELNITQKDADFLCKLMPGDILSMRADRDMISKIIRWWTGGKRSHTATYSGNGKVIEAIWCGVREAHWVETPYPARYNVIVLRKKGLTQEQAEAVISFQRSKIGLAYDFVKVIGLAGIWALKWIGIDLRKYKSWFNVKDMYMCVELLVDGFKAANIDLFTEKINPTQAIPQDLTDDGKDLEQVAEYIA